jgi:uncharacterized protein YjbJ (UPF0337 family)
MINQQELAGHWNEVRGKLKEKWDKLTDDDLRTFNGNVDQLIGRIQHKTGETREAIEYFLGQFSKESSAVLEAARERVQETAEHFADGMRQGYDGIRQGYAEAERVVQERPGQALAVAFGVGLLAGIGVTLLLRDSARHSMLEQSRGQGEHIGRYMRDMFAHMMPESLTKNGR